MTTTMKLKFCQALAAVLLLVLVFWTAPMKAQQGIAVSVRNGTADPAICQPTSLNIFLNRTSNRLKFCSATNTWADTGATTYPLFMPAGTTADPSITLAADHTTGWHFTATAFVWGSGGTNNDLICAQGCATVSGGTYSWSSSATDATAAADTVLSRAAAGFVGATTGFSGVYRITTRAVTNVSSPYTVAATDGIITCDATAGVVTINLPAATGTGRQITIKKIDASANACIPTRAGADTIDGATSYSLTTQYAASSLVDTAAAVWSRTHVNQVGGVLSGVSTNLTITSQTGTGTKFVVDTSPTIITPTIASFTNSAHNHQNAAGGGTLADAAITFTAPALGAPTATTLQTSGNVGIGVAPSSNAGLRLLIQQNGNQLTKAAVSNTDAASAGAGAVMAASADSATAQFSAFGSSFSGTLAGANLAGMASFNNGGTGTSVTVGSTSSVPVTIMTNATAAITISTAQSATFSGAIIPSQTIGITGTTTNNNANAGAVGEYQTGTVAANTTSLSTGTTANVGTNTNITLTAGDWDCSGVVNFTFGATTSITNLTGGISTTSATLPAQDSYFDYETSAIIPTGAAVATWVVPTVRLSNSGSTSVFLVSQATFTASTLKVGGTIRCRRMR